MPDSPATFFLTTPIYYVNARPHIGHAYTTIVADVLARRSRAQGTDTWFLTGTDEHGQKIERSAQAAGIPPQQFADEVSQSFRVLWQRMGITNDQFIRTTDEAHKRGAQKLFADLHAKGEIYLSSYTGQYSIGEEMFVEGPPGTIGPDGKPTETVTEENFFFRLSDYQLPLLDLIESDTLKITPEARKNEVLSFLRGNVSTFSDPPKQSVILSERSESKDPEEAHATQTDRPTSTEKPVGPIPTPSHPLDPIEPTGPTDLGPSPSREPEPTTSAPTSGLAFSKLGNPYVPGALRDLSVSRSSFTWGIPVPEPAASEAKEKHVIYVWLDALANYITALGYGDDSPEAQAQFQKFWPADLHLVGKEIIRFHCVYWPAFLLAAGLPLPKAVTAHGWLLFDDAKMSKSKGNIVRTETILSAFGTLCPTPSPNPITSVSNEARPLSSTPDEALKGRGFSPAAIVPSENRALAPEGILDDEVKGNASHSSSPQPVLLKGTPSGVPPKPTTGNPALAAEVRSSIPAPESLGASFLSQPHRGMSGNSESNPAPTGAPSSDDGAAVEQAGVPAGSLLSGGVERGVSSEARPFSSPSEEALKGRDFSPAAIAPSDNRALAPEGIPSSGLHPAPTGAPFFSESHPEKGGVSDQVRPSTPASPTPHQRDLFAADVLRYFLLREIPFGQDGSFTFEALITRYNADLANGYGNLVSRTLAMINQSLERTVPNYHGSDSQTSNYRQDCLPAVALAASEHQLLFHPDATAYPLQIAESLQSAGFSQSLYGVSVLVASTDQFLAKTKPWILAKTCELGSLSVVLYTAAESIRIITALLYPILPYAAASVWRQLGLGDIEQAAANGELKNLQWGGLQPGTKLGPLAPIFPRADKGLAQIMANMESEKNDLTTITSQQDAATPLQSEFTEAPIASEAGPAQTQSASFSVKSVVGSSSHPAAPPRTASLAEPNPGTHVAASSAHTTERPGTPSHSEASASGIFATPLEDPARAASTPQITIDDFAKVELRVAKILVCERIPKADKLLRLEVDLGYERRQILSGIAEWYTPEDLIGRRIVVITNLAPRKMRGLESHGMLLAASAEPSAEGEKPGKPHLATFADDDSEALPLGSRLK